MSGPELAGVLPVLQTPFDDEGDIDRASLGREIDWVLDKGCDGVVVAMVSEIMRLDVQERKALNEEVCALVAGRAPVIVSVGAESHVTARRMARHAQQSGADAVMAIPPVLTRLDAAALIDYYRGLFDAVDIPVVVQDASGYLGNTIPMEVHAALFESYSERVYYKPEATPIGPSLGHLMAVTGGGARVFEGTGGIALIDTYRRGVVGTMPAADVCWAIRALWDALQCGDEKRADAIAGPLCRFVSFQTTLDIFVATEKLLLKQQGVIANDVVRGPSAFEWDDASLTEIRHAFDLLRVAVASPATGSSQREERSAVNEFS